MEESARKGEKYAEAFNVRGRHGKLKSLHNPVVTDFVIKQKKSIQNLYVIYNLENSIKKIEKNKISMG